MKKFGYKANMVFHLLGTAFLIVMVSPPIHFDEVTALTGRLTMRFLRSSDAKSIRGIRLHPKGGTFYLTELRKEVKTPLVFMTYANVVFSYGGERFIATCEDIGIDGLILPDLPFEEKGEFQDICKNHGIDIISLIAPTSEGRIAMIAKEAEGFLYIVSSLGVTGMRTEIKTDLKSIIKVVRDNTDIPCAIGFGISTPEQAAKMAEISDGAIVGSAIVKLIEKYGKEAPSYVGEYVKSMKDALSK